jgi:hypothetical protein
VNVDLRCPVNPSRLFAKLQMQEAVIVEGNLIEVACTDCRQLRNDPDVLRVVHRFNVIGEAVETEVVRKT